jgi:2'-5' RNA ligase
VTVLFLGETAGDVAAPLTATVAAICSGRACLRLRGLDVATFGRPPKVLVWRLAGGGGGDPYPDLVRAVARGLAEQDLLPAGKQPKRRPVPHVTLARFRSPSEAASLREARAGEVCGRIARQSGDLELLFREVALFKSTLLPSGAQYERLARIPLGPAEA